MNNVCLSQEGRMFCSKMAEAINEMPLSKERIYAEIILEMLQNQYCHLNNDMFVYLNSLEDPISYLIEISRADAPSRAKTSIKKSLSYNIRTTIRDIINDDPGDEY